MEAFEQYHHYSQNLLLAQHEVSEIIRHTLTRGEVREDFIIQYLCRSIQNCDAYLKRGFVNLGEEEQSGQADIMLVRPFAETIDLGSRGNVIVNPQDCRMVIEVKSTLTGTYLLEFEEEAQRIKAANPNTICGMFAYKLNLEMKTIMERFGYEYNAEAQFYFDSLTDPLPLHYPHIDFILLLDKVDDPEAGPDLERQGQNQLFLRKGSELDARYFRGTHEPVIRNLVALVKSLLIGS